MTRIVVILLVSFCSALSLAQNFTANAEECGPDLNFPSSTFQGAVNNLQSFSYINHALSQVSKDVYEPVYCVSSVALSKDPSQFFRFFIQINVHGKYDLLPTYRFSFLLQDAPVQSFQVSSTQAWIALPLKDTDTLVDNFIATSDFQPVTAPTIGLTVLQAAMQSTTWQNGLAERDLATISIFRLMTKQHDVTEPAIYMVNWMTKSPTTPAGLVPVTKGILLMRKYTGEWLIAENVPLFSELLQPLENIMQQSVPAGPVDIDQWTANLLQISQKY